MKKKIKILLLATVLPLIYVNASYAEEVQAPNTVDTAVIVAQSTQSSPSTAGTPSVPTLVTPVAEDLKPENQATSKKIDLKAVIFDPNADFSAQAKEENREMTKVEEAQYNVHEALHGEVCKMNDMNKKGLLSKYLIFKPKGGIIESISEYTGYRGTLSEVWQGDEFKNTLYSADIISPTFEGKFKDKKTSFRSMFFVQPGKEGNDFFNDFWGDQYVQYAWSKNDQIILGYKRVTNGIDGSMGPWTLPLVNRTLIGKTYNNARSLGVKAQGSHKFYNYSLEFGSAGRMFKDWFPGPEFATSFDIKPLGKTDGRYGTLLLGGAFNAGNADARYTVGSAYIDYEYKRLNATVEYGAADGSNGSTGFTKNQSEGFNGTIAYRVTPKLQVLARYDHFDPNKSKRNDIRREYTAGLNYFVKGQALKLLLNYTLYSLETGVYGSRILLGTQILI